MYICIIWQLPYTGCSDEMNIVTSGGRMMGGILFAWLIGLFGITILVIWALIHMVSKDSIRYDEQFVWKRELSSEAKQEEE
ncbi:spore germination protein [Paenibacillus profundus]|uniref:Spore germination protein n=3 Tax=Paenibacillus TaxID=44249 RepID=A0ABS8YCS3_9BACL|nr:spore germination protein [Paenibacillus profundus]